MQVNFLTGGTQKGGTGAVHKFLSEHPQICLAKQKEVHFFDNDAFFRTHREPINYRPYHEYFTGRATTKVFGEATPIYMYWEPSAERIKAYNPSMRLIFILRDPIERAYSQYNMQRRRGIELLSFSTAIRLESVRCRQAFSLQRRRYSYVDRGFYSRQIKNMMRFFPREQMLFLKTEDLKHRHTETIDRICDFLGVARLHHDRPAIVSSHRYPSMSLSDKTFLKRKFEEEILELEALLGWDCASWMSA
jgi:hypothetical protein